MAAHATRLLTTALLVTALGAVAGTPAAAAAVPLPADTLRGTVRDTAGHPVAGAVVRLAELNLMVVTRSDGAFRFPAVPAGRYTVIVERDGFAPLVQPVRVPAAPLSIVLRESIVHLAPVTVTATRSAIDPRNSPLATGELSGERLRRFQEVSLAHALDGLPGVRTLSTGEQVGKPIIRGLAGPRVLTLDDGLRLEDYSWSDEDGPSVDTRLAARVEVIRGPASVLYGSDALGGVINVIPLEVPDGRGRSGFVRGAAELYGATNNAELGAVLRSEGASGAVGWRVTGIGRRANDFHTPPGNDSTPTGDLYNTGFHALNGEAVVGLRTDRGSVMLRYARYGGNFGLLDGPPVPSDNVSGPLRRLSDNRLQLTSSSAIAGVRLETKSQWQRHALQEVSDQSRTGDSTPTFDLLLNTFSTDVLLRHGGGGWLSGTLGASGLYQDNATRGTVPLVPAARTVAGGLFAFETGTLGRWTLLAGARVDARRLRADSNTTLRLSAQTRTAGAFTGDLGAVYRATPSLAVAANLGRAFRAPTLFELFTNGPHLGENRYEIGLPTAEPEVSLDADVSVRWQRGRVRSELAAYRNVIQGYLYIAPTGTIDGPTGLAIYRYHQADAVLFGAEAGAEAEATRFLTLRARIDLVRGENRATDQPLPLMAPPRADLETEWHATGLMWADRVYVSAGEQIVTRQLRLGPFDSQTPAYHLLDLGVGVEEAVGGRLVHLDIRVRNAADARYTDFLSRYKSFAYGQGRNVTVQLSSGL
ncbi:MAG TPA: TonB-dependent receptor [Gemmatimonadales bacterium]|nr:TonB-dependent receptor [Gemmatimonadales bacterium]